MRNLSSLRYAAVLAAGLFFSACSNTPDQAASTIANASQNTANSEVRKASATQGKIAGEYYYKTLAAFQKGKTSLSVADLAALQGKRINLVVLYESGAPWASPFDAGDFSKTGDDKMNGVLASYNLTITKHFELDELNEGLVLEGKGEISNPVEAARELSMIDHILMVEVKELPQNAAGSETVSN